MNYIHYHPLGGFLDDLTQTASARAVTITGLGTVTERYNKAGQILGFFNQSGDVVAEVVAGNIVRTDGTAVGSLQTLLAETAPGAPSIASAAAAAVPNKMLLVAAAALLFLFVLSKRK